MNTIDIFMKTLVDFLTSGPVISIGCVGLFLSALYVVLETPTTEVDGFNK